MVGMGRIGPLQGGVCGAKAVSKLHAANYMPHERGRAAPAAQARRLALILLTFRIAPGEPVAISNGRAGRME